MAWRRPTDKPLSEHDGWFTDAFMHYSASMSLGSTTSNDANLCWVGSSNDNLKIWATSREEKMPSQPSDINVSWTNMTPEDTITWRHKKTKKKTNKPGDTFCITSHLWGKVLVTVFLVYFYRHICIIIPYNSITPFDSQTPLQYKCTNLRRFLGTKFVCVVS